METQWPLLIFFICIFGFINGSSPKINFSLSNAVKTDIQYRLINSRNEKGTLLDENTISHYPLNKTLPTKLFIHGWADSENSTWYKPLKNAYLTKSPHNIFYIDWSKDGHKQYEISAANTKSIGKFIGDFIIASGISLEKIHVIGHSMGSHIAGFLGKHIFVNTGTKIYRITGTDPAGVMFDDPTTTEDDRLSENDAGFVDIIHTDIGHFGYVGPIGHVDFYPNGGHSQPGCPPLEEDAHCSHDKSNIYFITSIKCTNIMATQCLTWKKYLCSSCDTNSKTVFGDKVDVNSRGVYFLKIEASAEDSL